MAGFMVFIGGRDAQQRLERVVSSGTYAAKLRPLVAKPGGGLRFGAPHEGTFADYSTAQPGDSVFFFSNRVIYGVGRLVALGRGPALLNYPGASEPRRLGYSKVRELMLLDEGAASMNQRWLFTFVPDPAFFRQGVVSTPVET